MNKKRIIITIIIIIAIVFIIYLINFIFYKNKLNKIQYEILKNEYVLKEFKYKNKNYKITAVSNGRDGRLGTDLSYENFILEEDGKNYLLGSTKQCHSNSDIDNIYIDKNDVYIHCLNTNGNIYKYTIKGLGVSYKVYYLNYDDTPNISQYHIGIDDVKGDTIYLSSKVKFNSSLIEGNNVKCSLKNEKCEYDSKDGYGKKDMNYNEEQQHIYDLFKKEAIKTGIIEKDTLKDLWIDSIYENGFYPNKPNHKYIGISFNVECQDDTFSCLNLNRLTNYHEVESTYDIHSNNWSALIITDEIDYIEIRSGFSRTINDGFITTGRIIKEWE